MNPETKHFATFLHAMNWLNFYNFRGKSSSEIHDCHTSGFKTRLKANTLSFTKLLIGLNCRQSSVVIGKIVYPKRGNICTFIYHEEVVVSLLLALVFRGARDIRRNLGKWFRINLANRSDGNNRLANALEYRDVMKRGMPLRKFVCCFKSVSLKCNVKY